MIQSSSKGSEEISMDDAFLEKIRKYVLANISCEEFSLDRLAEELGYSRSQIHRKLKKILGKSVSQFIRELRLEEANRLLRAKAGTVSEISFRVGFGSPVYFNKCFHEFYGITPGEAIRKGTSEIADGNDKGKKQNGFFSWNSPNLFTVVTAIIIVVVGILLYPRIFKKDHFKSLRGKDGRVSIIVFPLSNITNDPTINIWQAGIQMELIAELSESKELLVYPHQTIYQILAEKEISSFFTLTPFKASEISRKMNSRTFILGNIIKSGENILVNIQLIDSYTEELIKSFQKESNSVDDIIPTTDSLSMDIKNYLEIQSLEKDAAKMILNTSNTSSPEAYRFYLKGLNLYMDRKYDLAIELLNEAYQIDNDFVTAPIMIIFSLFNLNRHEEAKVLLEDTYDQIENVSYADQLMLKYIKSLYDKDPDESKKYTQLYLAIYPLDRNVWYHQGWNYVQTNQFEDALIYLEKALAIDELWGRNSTWWPFFTYTGKAYHELGNHYKENEIYKLGLKLLPDNPSILRLQAICAFSQGDTIIGREYMNKYRAILNAEGWTENNILCSLGEIYRSSGFFDQAERFFVSVISNQPDHLPGLRYLISLYIADDINQDNGMKLLERAIEYYPDDYYFLEYKGWGLFNQGKLEDAQSLLEKSWNLRPLYDHNHYLRLQEVEQTLARQKSEQ